MNPHNNPNMMQPMTIPVHNGLLEGCIFKIVEIAVTIKNAQAAHIEKVNRPIMIVSIQNENVVSINSPFTLNFMVLQD